MITTRIIGSNGQQLRVNGEGEISVTNHTHPPVDEVFESLPFRTYFTNSAGSNNMVGVGTLATPLVYSIDADSEFDYYIKSLSIKVADTGAQFDEFGALTALTNGVEFSWDSQKAGKLTIHEGIKDNLEFFRLSQQAPVIIDLSGVGADAVLIDVDLALLFGTPWGLRLTKGTTERLSFSVRDDLTGVTEFNIIGYGIKL